MRPSEIAVADRIGVSFGALRCAARVPGGVHGDDGGHAFRK